MAESQSFLSVLSGLLVLAASARYVWSAWLGVTRPRWSSWLIWTLLQTVIVIGMLRLDTLSIQVATIAVVNVASLAVSFRNGFSRPNRVELCCLVGAALGFAALHWSPLYAVFIGLSVSAIGSIPTYVHGWERPEEEDRLAWWLSFSSSVAGFTALPEYSMEAGTPAVVYLALGFIMIGILEFQHFTNPRLLHRKYMLARMKHARRMSRRAL